jgi:dTDP-4-dehydrorhamnose reductase
MASTLLIGSNGQLGADLIREAGDRQVTELGHTDLDITDRDAVAACVVQLKPDLIVNCAAYVDVEGCETDRERAFAVNADGVRNLVATGVRLVHISTDYVFDGRSREPYTEEAATNPINVYGASKLAGEQHARGQLIVRSSGLYGVTSTRTKGNFVQTMLRLGRERGEVSVVTDQVLAPTSSADLARTLWALIDGGAHGVYHATNSGECSWFEFAKAIFEIAGMDVRVNPTTSDRLDLKAARPPYSVLDNSKLAGAGYPPLRPWREALAAHLDTTAGAG